MSVISVPQAFNEDELYVDLRSIFGQSLFLKCEGFNFAGSVKLKAATEMVEEADREGLLPPGAILVESSSGNLGVALSVIAASKGYEFLRMTDSRCNLSARLFMEALGSQVHIMTYLEQYPRELPDLRYVSVTGEALKRELTERWFAAQPGIKLVNAYGLTETSDDTNHEVMDAPPDRGLVPLGRPVANAGVYVVDEHLSPVPLGAPGLIAFSGVCVGRGYVNDPEHTRQAYLADPHREGQRLYLGGDYGRWRPDGKLEFLGRRDTQVKISGFRIEIGEIENALLRVPGVRDGAVVVTGGPGQGSRLVAFYAGPQPLPADALRDRLAESLPGYMVPAAFWWRESLPLTANSKIDTKALKTLAATLASSGPDDRPAADHAPGTATEQRLAAAWAKVLGIPADQIGRHDNFFDRGGTSLSAVKLAITLDRAVSLRELITYPVLADLAALVDGRLDDLSIFS